MTMADAFLSRSLGDQESWLLTSLSAAGYTVFTIEDARAILGPNYASARKLLHRLHRKRWIRRLERGRYLILPLAAGPDAQWAEHEYLIAASLVKPCYLAYATALRYYGYGERPLGPVIIATTQRKQPLTIDDLTYRFVTLTPRKFFGFVPITLEEHTIQMAEREKALSDGFDHPELVGGVLEAAKGLWFGAGELDWERLVRYTLRLGNKVATRRMGFWLELLELTDEEFLTQLKVGAGHSYARLEPGGLADGPRNARWRLIVNVPERQLLEWREH
jgi:predicted transcriptional regulator of viral defense system